MKSNILIKNSSRTFSLQEGQQASIDKEHEEHQINPEEEKNLSQTEIFKKMKDHFPGMKIKRFPTRCSNLNFEKDILPAEEKLINVYGFKKEEINFVMKYKPSFILVDILGEKEGMQGIHKFFVEKKGFDLDLIRTLVVKYPYIVSKTEKDFDNYFRLMQQQGLSEEDSMKILLDCPKLISKNLEKSMNEIFFLFNLYHGINQAEVMGIFQSFPYLFCCEVNKIQKYMGEFRKYRFTKDQIIRLCKESGGILASKVSSFVGLFDYLKQQHNIKATDVVQIIDQYPEFVFQNKKDLLRRKIALIRQHSKASDTFIKSLIKRHPNLFLKSWASMEAKINYIVKGLGRQIIHEKSSFPLLLEYNYNSVLKPRCELLKDKVKHFEFYEILPLTDEQFCLAYGIAPADLEKKIAERPQREEKDNLWSYVAAL